MADYQTMQSRIADELQRPDLTNQIAAAIQTAITQYQHERFWFSEARAVSATVAGQANYDLPADLIEIDTVAATRNGVRYPLDMIYWHLADDLLGLSLTDGAPLWYAVQGNQLWLYPTPDAAYPLTVSYAASIAAPVSGTDSNAWTNEAEALIRQRAKVIVALDVIRDAEAAQAYGALEQDALARLRNRTDRLLMTGRIRPTPF